MFSTGYKTTNVPGELKQQENHILSSEKFLADKITIFKEYIRYKMIESLLGMQCDDLYVFTYLF